MTDTPAPVTPRHPWDVHDDSCNCHVGICLRCVCTNELEARSEPMALDTVMIPRSFYEALVRYDEGRAAEYARLSEQPEHGSDR